MATGFDKLKSKLEQERGVGFSPELEQKPRPANEARASLHRAIAVSELVTDVPPATKPVRQDSDASKPKSSKVCKSYNLDKESLQLLKDIRYVTNKSFSSLLIEGIQLLKDKYIK